MTAPAPVRQGPPSVPAGAAPAAGSPSRAHLPAIDVARLFAVTGVIVVHTTSLTADPGSLAAGGILVVLHITREVFLFLSAFVLAYTARQPAPRGHAFWRRRFPLVAIPYAAWTAIYVVADGHYGSVPAMVGRFAEDLVTSGAHFHLYFLLLTLQLYIVFPVLLTWVDRSKPRHLIVGAAVFQLAFTAAIHYRLHLPAPASTWLSHPGSWLPSYALYVVAGLVAGRHYQAMATWLGARARLVAGVAGGAVALGLASYFADTQLIGMQLLREAVRVLRASHRLQRVVPIDCLVQNPHLAVVRVFHLGKTDTKSINEHIRQHRAEGTDSKTSIDQRK